MTKSDSDFASLDKKLAILLNLNAYLIAKEMTVAHGAPILKRLGLSASDIAAVFDSTAKAVNVRLAEAKKKGKATRRKAPKGVKKSKGRARPKKGR